MNKSSININGENLAETCPNNNYICANTFFIPKNRNKANLSTWTGPGGKTAKKIDYFLIDRKNRNWITKLSNKHIANPRQSKQRKIILGRFQIKLQNNPKNNNNNNNNNLPYCVNSLRDNLQEFNDIELKLIKSCVNYDNDNWWADTSNKISQILKKNYPKNKKLIDKDEARNKSHLDNLRDKRKISIIIYSEKGKLS